MIHDSKAENTKFSYFYRSSPPAQFIDNEG